MPALRSVVPALAAGLLLLATVGCAARRAPEPAPAPPAPWRAVFETTKGTFVIKVHPEWAPIAAGRFGELVAAQVQVGARFFRVVPQFVVQWGLAADPAVTATWQQRTLKDELPRVSNQRGTVTFAQSGAPNSRSMQVFVNLTDNTYLDRMRFAPFGEIVEGMDVVASLHSEGEGRPNGPGPDQMRVMEEGEAYLASAYPALDRILAVRRE
jgi:peptidyl-prolyl cis-trans isomerase A (cyclophilin A)